MNIIDKLINKWTKYCDTVKKEKQYTRIPSDI